MDRIEDRPDFGGEAEADRINMARLAGIRAGAESTRDQASLIRDLPSQEGTEEPRANFVRSDPRNIPATSLARIRSAPGKCRVLIADDDQATRHLLKLWLEESGFATDCAEDGRAAYKLLGSTSAPTILLLDWQMPNCDGIELCKRIRGESSEPYVYVLMMSGRSKKHDISLALESGADDYITKPFGARELLARLNTGERIIHLQDELIRSREELRSQAVKDFLTGLWNRSAFLKLLENEIRREARSKEPVGLLLIDVDHFKRVNDTYGHLAGDTVLREVARRLVRSVRSYDPVGRYGGEELCVCLPGCSGLDLRRRAEAIRQAIAGEPFQMESARIPVTVSIGASVALPSESSVADVLAVADVALYKAKRAGRNHAAFCEMPWSDLQSRSDVLLDRCGGCSSNEPNRCLISQSSMTIYPSFVADAKPGDLSRQNDRSPFGTGSPGILEF